LAHIGLNARDSFKYFNRKKDNSIQRQGDWMGENREKNGRKVRVEKIEKQIRKTSVPG